MDHFDFELLHVRPRFRFTVPYESEVLIAHLTSKFNAKDHPFPTKVRGHFFVLDVPDQLAHYWSPRVTFEIEKDDEDPTKSLVRGIIGPKPQVWTMFVFIYFSVGVVGLFVTLLGLSKMALGGSSILVWAFPLALLVMSTAYIASKSGQKIGAKQVELLKVFFRDSWKELKD